MAKAGDGVLPQAREAKFQPYSLDAVNFLLADVRGALGPYLNVFLITQQHWSQTEIGWVTTIGGLVGLAAQTPAGAVIDATRRKREAVVLALIVLGMGPSSSLPRPVSGQCCSPIPGWLSSAMYLGQPSQPSP